MTEHPIIFSGRMVRAILDGKKTQTRRIVNMRNVDYIGGKGHEDDPNNWGFADEYGDWYVIGRDYPRPGMINSGDTSSICCPYGEPPMACRPNADRLWVRESWRIGAWKEDGRIAIDYRASPEENRTPWCNPGEEAFDKLISQSDDDCEMAIAQKRGSVRRVIDDDGYDLWKWDRGDSPCRWRPSIHMPRWATRLRLEITDVRVERVQSISDDDARAEGVDTFENAYPACRDQPLTSGELATGHRGAYAVLWDDLNAERGSWKTNPWVWAITFRRVS